MLTFEQFLYDSAQKGEAVNLMFEQRLFDLVGVLHKITVALVAENVPHELVGGLAVLVHVEEADPTHSTLTWNVDVMIRRSDLEAVKEIAARHGFRYRHSAGLDMLIFGHADSAGNAVHLIFSGEKVKAGQAAPNPPIAPVRKTIYGTDVLVVPVADLLQMKLSAFRDKDRVHVRSLDAAGLITETMERALPEELRSRLQHVRETE